MTQELVVWLPVAALSPLLAQALLEERGLVPVATELLEEALSHPAWSWPLALQRGRTRLGEDWGPLIPVGLPLSLPARWRLHRCAQEHDWPLDAAAAALLLSPPLEMPGQRLA